MPPLPHMPSCRAQALLYFSPFNPLHKAEEIIKSPFPIPLHDPIPHMVPYYCQYFLDASTANPCLTPFCFNAPCQFTPLLDLRSRIFGLTPFFIYALAFSV